MVKINIKPISVNACWAGRRFKTPLYKKYEQDVLMLLPSKIDLPQSPYEITLVFGFSSASSDFDNPIKPFVDCLQKKYGFNDKLIKRAVIDIEKVKKGKEFILFELKHYKNDTTRASN